MKKKLLKFNHYFIKFLKKKIIKQLFGFFFVGLFSNFISFALYLIVYNFIYSSLIISSIFGQILGFISNYFLNSNIVFAKKVNLTKKIIYFIYYFLMLLIFSFSTEFLTVKFFDYRVSWFLCAIFASILNFTFLRFFTFRD